MVTSPKSGPWWVLWIYVCLWLVHAPKVFQLCTNGRNPNLGFATKAKVCKGVGQEVCEKVWEWRLTLPSELPFWELESRWTLEPSKSNCKGQNTSHWGVLYIIENILKCRCLELAHMTHLDICNTSYGKKKGRESKLAIWLPTTKSQESTQLPCVQVVCDTHWKTLDEICNFALDLIPIGGLSTKL